MFLKSKKEDKAHGGVMGRIERMEERIKGLKSDKIPKKIEGKKIEKLESSIRMVFSDTGIGMEKEETEKIFESFVRGERGMGIWIKGAGLGLYLARKYVELHKGRIWARSFGRDKGSTFYIELPIK